MTKPNQPPPHPGVILERDFMRPQGIAPAQLAEKLGEPWNEAKITSIIAGQQGISEKSAHDLALFFKTTPEFWNQLQQTYFLWAKMNREIEKGPLKPKKTRVPKSPKSPSR